MILKNLGYDDNKTADTFTISRQRAFFLYEILDYKKMFKKFLFIGTEKILFLKT